jgi:rhodanese-related sulfurtransferase
VHKLILIALIAVAATWAQQGDLPRTPGAAGKAAPSKAKVLTRVELDQLLATPDKVLLIDVRRPDEISSNGGFPVYLSIQAGELEKHLADIPRDRVIVTVSNHAARGGRAADILANNGFKVAGAVGAETYEAEGGKLVRVAAPPPRGGEKK